MYGKRPENWEELRAAAIEQVKDFAGRLRDEADNMDAFARDVERWLNHYDDLTELQNHLKLLDFFTLKDAPCLDEILTWWPQCKSAPGEGYW